MHKTVVRGIVLRKVVSSDFPALATLREDRELQHALMSYPRSGTPLDIQHWIDRRLKHGALWAIADKFTDECLGYVQLANFHRQGRFAWLGIALVPNSRGQGIGHDAIEALKQEATILGLRKLMLEVRADNSTAHRLYEKSGFSQVGRLMSHYYDGEKYHDSIIMESFVGGYDVKTVAISQPMYFPWAGFIDMMRLADTFIWLDDVQFSKGSFTNRVQIKMPQGSKWMTVPLLGKGSFQVIGNLREGNEFWRKQHRLLLKASLKNSPHLALVLEVFDRVTGYSPLNEALVASATEVAETLGVLPSQCLRSSEMGIPGKSWQRIIDLVSAVGGTLYISGNGGVRYLDHLAFERAGLRVEYMDYRLKPWKQSYGEFTPYLTCLDLLAARGHNSRFHLTSETVPWRRRLEDLGIS
ncbi:MAG: WbqC family protein [Candidatus Poribacteria bacterium]|nr:WbqC family protein [Candidatus Poribacteria bacterium]